MARKSLIPILVLGAAAGIAVIAHYLASVQGHGAAARADCTAVGQYLGGSPSHKPGFVVREVMHPRPSRNRALDGAMRHLAAALRGSYPAGANMAFSRVRAICAALGMWHSYH